MIVPVMAISNLVLSQQIYSEETNGAHAHNRDRVSSHGHQTTSWNWQKSVEIPENMHAGGNRPAHRAKLSVLLLHRQRAIIWYAFGVAWLISRVGGVVLKTMLCAKVWICWVFVPGLTPVIQSSVSPSNWGGVCV